MRIYKLISIVVIISFLTQDIAWASPYMSALNVNSTFDSDPRNRDWLTEMKERYIAGMLTEGDEGMLRGYMAEIPDPGAREIFARTFGLAVSSVEKNSGRHGDIRLSNIIQDDSGRIKITDLEAPLSKRIEEEGGDGYIWQGDKSIAEFMEKRSEIEKNDITAEYKGRVREVPAGCRIYGFTSIVKGRDDFFLGYYDAERNKLYLATDLISELEACGPPSLVDEYLLHEILCPALGHYEAIKAQRDIFANHYKPENWVHYDEDVIRDKGIFKYRIRGFIDRKYIPVLREDALERTVRDERFTMDDYGPILEDEVLFDRIHELRMRMWKVYEGAGKAPEAVNLVRRIYEGLAEGYMEDKQYHEGRVQDDLTQLEMLIHKIEWRRIESLIINIEDEYGLKEAEDIDKELEFIEIAGFGRNAVIKKVRNREGDVYALKCSSNLVDRTTDLLIYEEYRILRDLQDVQGVPKVYRNYRTTAISMELIEGRNLTEAGPQDGDFFARLEETAWAIFKKGYTMEDLRDENIMVRGDGAPIIIDFAAYKKYSADERERYRKELQGRLANLRGRYLKKADVVISSEGTRMGHPDYHRLGGFEEVIGEIANELFIFADRDGRYDLRRAVRDRSTFQSLRGEAEAISSGLLRRPDSIGTPRNDSLSGGGRRETRYGELRIEPDGILVIIDSRFKKDHAGRRQMAVYARNESKAVHELTELRVWIDYAKKELGMTDEDIRQGRLNQWMQARRNSRTVRDLYKKFHKQGQEAERESLAAVTARGIVVTEIDYTDGAVSDISARDILDRDIHRQLLLFISQCRLDSSSSLRALIVLRPFLRCRDDLMHIYREIQETIPMDPSHRMRLLEEIESVLASLDSIVFNAFPMTGIVRTAVRNLGDIINSRKEIRDVLNLISPFKIRFVINSPSPVRIFKEDNKYILELDLFSFLNKEELNVAKRMLRVQLWRVTASMVLDTVETSIPKDMLIDVLLILLDAQDINRRYRSGNRKIIAKKTRRAYLGYFGLRGPREYAMLIKRLSHLATLEERIRLVYLYLTKEGNEKGLAALQEFFARNRSILIKVKLAYTKFRTRRVRDIEVEHLRMVEREGEVDRVPDYAPAHTRTERGGAVERPAAARGPAREEVEYRYHTPNRGEGYYAQKIRELIPLLENPDEAVCIRIFLGQIFPWYLIARADHADGAELRRLVEDALDRTVSGEDHGFSQGIRLLMDTRDRPEIKRLAGRFRNSPYLLRFRIYFGVDLAGAVEGDEFIDVLYAIVHEIDEVRQFRAYNRQGQDGEDLPIYYLGRRIDNLDREMGAFGFTYRGDMFGAVIKGEIRRYVNYNLMPILEDRPYATADRSRIHPLTYAIEQAVKRDFRGMVDSQILGEMEQVTAIHELQHTVDELLNPDIDSASTETSAYLAGIALSECPYVSLRKVIELYTDSLVDLFSPPHSIAAGRIMDELKRRLGVVMEGDREDVADAILRRALELEEGALASLAKGIHRDLFGPDALVRLEPLRTSSIHRGEARLPDGQAIPDEISWRPGDISPHQFSKSWHLRKRNKVPFENWCGDIFRLVIAILLALIFFNIPIQNPVEIPKETVTTVPDKVIPETILEDKTEQKPKQESFEHTVRREKPDDCLWHIAKKYYAVSSRRIEEYIAEYNNRNNPKYRIKDIDIIIDGKRIVLPYKIVHKVRGKNVHVRQVARMYNVSEGYLRAMNWHIPLDGRLRRGAEIEIAVRIDPSFENIGKGVEYIVNPDGTLTITKKGKTLAENLPVNPADINKARILGVVRRLNAYKEFREEFIRAFDSVNIMVFSGTERSHRAGAFAHMGEDGVLYIDSVLLNNDMAIIHEVTHAYLKSFAPEDLIAMVDRTDAKDRIKKKAGDNPALLRHYYARYYLQNSIEGEYGGSPNWVLADEIRVNMLASTWGIEPVELADILDNLGDSAESFRLREAFIKLIKEDGEITQEELGILVKHIENVMKVFDQLTGVLSDGEKREAIIRVALYLSIEEIRRVKELETRPKGDIRRYFYQRIEVARRLGVSPQEIESINPNSTNVAVVINKYFKDRKERQEVAGKVVDIVTRYLLAELEVDKKTEDCIKRIIRGKDVRIVAPLSIVVEVSGNVILQDLSIYSRENLDSLAIGVIRDLTKGNQQIMAYTEETQKVRFIRLLEEKGVAELQDKLVFIDISRCNSYEDIKREVSKKLGLSTPRLISVVKSIEKRFETKDPNDRIVVAGSKGIVDLYLMWKVTLLLLQSEGDIRSSLKTFLMEYYKGTEYKGKVSDLVEEMFRHGIYIVLPPIVPFMKDYYELHTIADRFA